MPSMELNDALPIGNGPLPNDTVVPGVMSGMNGPLMNQGGGSSTTQTPSSATTLPEGNYGGAPPAGVPQAATYVAGQGSATPYTVSPDQTVASQVDKLIAENSPLMQRATADARDQAQARGLMNSTMATTAGEAALYDKAMPIATADAATYDRAATNTATAKNQMEQFNVGARNTAFGANMTQQNSLSQTRMNNESALQIQALQNEGNLKNIMAQGAINQQLQTLNNTNKLQLQTSANASQLYSQALQFMGTISVNPDLSPEQKSAALNNSVQELSDALHVMNVYSGMPDIQSMLKFNVPFDSSGNSNGSTSNQNQPSSGPPGQFPGFNAY